jgi:predicted outer membrane lipoprotein
MSIETILLIVLGLAFSVIIILWVEGIDYMNKNYPDYKGDEFFNEEDKKDEGTKND